jgi:hypothetical protein
MIGAQKDAAPVAQSFASTGDANIKTSDLPVGSILDAGEMFMVTVGSYPKWMQTVMRVLPWNAVGMLAQLNLLGLAVASVSARLGENFGKEGQEKSEEHEISGDEKNSVDLIDKLLEVRGETGLPLSKKEIIAEAMVFLAAGSDTTTQ